MSFIEKATNLTSEPKSWLVANEKIDVRNALDAWRNLVKNVFSVSKNR